jgi:diguanylate cyclase (GGDEF)-like protein/PAS domain S-box-containing protein
MCYSPSEGDETTKGLYASFLVMTVAAKNWRPLTFAHGLAIAATVWAAGYPILFATLKAQAGTRPLTILAFPPMNLVTCFMAWFAASRVSDERIRRAFRWFGIAWLFVLAGNALSFMYTNILNFGDYTGSWWVNTPYLLWYPLFVAGLVSLPLASRQRIERRKFLFDALTIMLSGGIAIWQLVIVPTVSETPSPLATLIALLYPLGSILVLAGLTTVLLRRLPARGSVASALFFSGVTLFALSDLSNDIVLTRVGPFGMSWTDIPMMVSYALIIWGLYRSAADPDQGAPDVTETDIDAAVQSFSPLPYAALAFCLTLLLHAAWGAQPASWSLLAITTVVVTILVVTRRIAAVRENARLVSERAMRQNEARFRSLVQHSSDVIAVVDPTGTINYVSPSATRVFGFAPEEIEGRSITSLLHSDDASRGETMFIEAALRPGVTAPSEWRVQHRDGRWLYVEAVGTNLVHEPAVRGIVVNTRDITERKSLEAQLVHQAFHDPLTGLANRALFLDRVTHALAITVRHGRHPVAVMFLDIDNFKSLNDSFGHLPADQLLSTIARRLCDAVRTSDTVARLGGDEFAILLEDASGPMAPAAAAERITTSLREPFTLEGKEVYASASIGIAVATPDLSPSELLRNADTAMYQAKARGKARYELFEASMYAETLARLELESELRQAVERNELSLRYQPIDLVSGVIVGIEALLRWEHPRRGTLGPDEFMHVAEETGLIVPIGRWVLREACRRARRWQLMYPRAMPLSLSVNISSQQLQHPSLVDVLRSALSEHELPPSSLVLEITESVLMQQSEVMLTHLKALKTLSVRLAIDDFGTGYSSLAHLRRFPIDVLKIAKPFVDDVSELADSALARAIIGLGQTLRLETIAEGIESPDQLNELRVLGCHLGQGNYFARPVTADAMDALLAAPLTIAIAQPAV